MTKRTLHGLASAASVAFLQLSCASDVLLRAEPV
jgi:hypothetical protein